MIAYLEKSFIIYKEPDDYDAIDTEYPGGKFIDKETSSIWDITGKAVMGVYRGKHLKRINSGDYFAFAWLAFYPDTKIYKK